MINISELLKFDFIENIGNIAKKNKKLSLKFIDSSSRFANDIFLYNFSKF